MRRTRMMSRLGRPIIASLVALLAIVILQWYDASVLADAQRRMALTFDSSELLNLLPVGHLLAAAGVIVIVAAAWWSRSLSIGLGFTVAGGFLVLLPTLVSTFAISVNGAPTRAPDPIASALSDWFFTVERGLTGAVFTLGAAMLLSGLAVIGSLVVRRRRAAGSPSSEAALPESGAATPSGQLRP